MSVIFFEFVSNSNVSPFKTEKILETVNLERNGQERTERYVNWRISSNKKKKKLTSEKIIKKLSRGKKKWE